MSPVLMNINVCVVNCIGKTIVVRSFWSSCAYKLPKIDNLLVLETHPAFAAVQ